VPLTIAAAAAEATEIGHCQDLHTTTTSGILSACHPSALASSRFAVYFFFTDIYEISRIFNVLQYRWQTSLIKA